MQTMPPIKGAGDRSGLGDKEAIQTQVQPIPRGGGDRDPGSGSAREGSAEYDRGGGANSLAGR